jgi:MFS superfamily sulfate permease-like transporter
MTRRGEDDPPEAPTSGVPARDGYGRGVSPFRPDARRPLLQRLVPVSEQLPGYRGGLLRRDLLAGVTLAALALPAAMAYGELAGLSPTSASWGSGSSAWGVRPTSLDDRLFFANAGYVTGRVREAVHGSPTPVRRLVFDAEALTHLDATGARALGDMIRSFQADGIVFVFARVKGPMRQTLDNAGIVELVGPDHLYPTVRAAVQAAPSAGEEQQ